MIVSLLGQTSYSGIVVGISRKGESGRTRSRTGSPKNLGKKRANKEEDEPVHHRTVSRDIYCINHASKLKAKTLASCNKNVNLAKYPKKYICSRYSERCP